MRIGNFLKILTTHDRKSSPKSPLSAWEKSARLAGTIVNPGPDVSRLKAIEVVVALRKQSAVAEAQIRKVTKLEASPAHQALYGEVLAEVQVVDRASWALSAARSMAELFRIDEAVPLEGKPDPTDLNGLAETTAALTFLSQRTLGQFVPNFDKASGHLSFAQSPGQLLLVAPNVLMQQRAMAVDLNQFALWICLHEYTHALQFAAADWLPGYMQARIDTVVRSFDSESSLLEWARALAESIRGRDSMMDRLLNDAQREELGKITALMSVLEGHADVMMDLVPAHLLPTRRALRRKFNARRKENTKLASAVNRVSGMSAKTAQYQNGAQFVRDARKLVGAEGFNRVFQAAEFLPTVAELDNAEMWAERTNRILESGAAVEAARILDNANEGEVKSGEFASQTPAAEPGNSEPEELAL